MGILSRKVEQKLRESKNPTIAFDIKMSPTEPFVPYGSPNGGDTPQFSAQEFFQKVNTFLDTSIKSIYDVYNDIMFEIQKLPNYDLSPLKKSIDGVIVELNDLHRDYQKYQQEGITAVLANLVFAQTNNFSPEVQELRSNVNKLFLILKEIRSQAQEFFNSVTNTDPITNKARWELAYLANMSYNAMKTIISLNSDRNIWVEKPSAPTAPPTAPQSKENNEDIDKFLKTQPELDPNDRLNLFKEDHPTEHEELNDVPDLSKEEKTLDLSKSKLLPLSVSTPEAIKNFSTTAPKGSNPQYEIGEVIDIGWSLRGQVIGYKVGVYHKISYIIQSYGKNTMGRLYSWEPHYGIRRLNDNGGVMPPRRRFDGSPPRRYRR